MLNHYEENQAAQDSMTSDQEKQTGERATRTIKSRYPARLSSEPRAFWHERGALEIRLPSGDIEMRKGNDAVRWLDDEIEHVRKSIDSFRMDLDQLHLMKEHLEDYQVKRHSD